MKEDLFLIACEIVSHKNKELLVCLWEMDILQIRFTVLEFQNMGFTPTNAKKIYNLLAFAKKYRTYNNVNPTQIRSSKDCYHLFSQMIADESVEHFALILLNRANRVIKTEIISVGGVNGCVADTKVIFKKALEYGASSIILAHNHPSGNLRPSGADIELTEKMKNAGKAIDIPVLDHLIVTNVGYYSFGDEGQL